MKALQQGNAFVIQFRDTGACDAGRYCGRIEHVASGRATSFRSLGEVPDLLLQMLKRAASDEEQRRG
jgi:hypothetical protein